MSKFSDDCYSTVLVYSMQLNGLLLALLTGLYVIDLKKNTSFHITTKANIVFCDYFPTHDFTFSSAA